MLLQILGHIQPHHIALVVKEKLGQGFGQFRLAHPRRPQKDKAADRPPGIAEAGTGPADGFGNRRYRLLLPNQPLMQRFLHIDQPLCLPLQQPPGRDTRPAGNQLGNIPLLDHQVDFALLPQLGPFRFILGLQPQPFRFQLRRFRVFGTLGGGLLLIRQLTDAVLQFLQIVRQPLGVNPQLAGRFIDEINGLVRQLPGSDVAVAEPGRRLQRRIVNLDLVMGFVAGPQSLQDPHRILRAGLLQIDGLEPPFQGGVLFDMAAVFIRRSGPDALEFPPGQSRLQQIAGIHSPLAGPGPHHSVHFIQKKDDLAVGLLHLVHHRLEPLLELPAKLGTGHQRSHIQSQHPPLLQGIGNIPGGYPRRQPFGNGRLAHAGLSDDDRIVLFAAGQSLHHPPNFPVPPDNRIEHPIRGQPRQVNAVFFQRAVTAFRFPIGNPMAAAHPFQGLINPFRVNAELPVDLRRIALRLLDRGDKEMLDADVFVVQMLGFLPGRLQQLLRPGRNVNLLRRRNQLGRRLQQPIQPRLDRFRRNAQLRQDPRRNVLIVRQQGHIDMLHIPLAVAIAAHQLLGVLDGLLRPLGEILRFQFFCLLLNRAAALNPGRQRRRFRLRKGRPTDPVPNAGARLGRRPTAAATPAPPVPVHRCAASASRPPPPRPG